jgi:hypothetical protein
MFGEDVSEHPETLSRSSVRLYVFSELVAGNFVLFTTIPIRIRNWYVPMFCYEGKLILLIQSISDDSRAREFSHRGIRRGEHC